ncbi:MAG TPA: hypothetical protein VLB44_10495 [Kofleriaceae bacterium]|nr:hypothetical protein [Kofleriaceae bacterium]
MRAGLLLWISLVLVVSCGNKGEKVTREDCSKVADHIADLVVDHLTSHPDELLEQVGSNSGLPAGTTKDTLPPFLASPEGKTWLLQRRGLVRTGVEQGIDKCVSSASRKQVTCLLAAKTRDDVTACDAAK